MAVQDELIPWDILLGYGLGVLKLPPESFWGLTLRELALLMDSPIFGNANGTLSRADFEVLFERFPDNG